MISKHTFEGGMNYDLDESMLQANMYRYALNIRNSNSETGSIGTISNAEGNQIVTFTLPTGGNTVVGALDDEANDRVIYIVYNTEGDNRILAYDYKNAVTQTIVADSGNILDLSAGKIIKGMNVILGNGSSYLLYVDDFGEPKNIDIDAGIRTYDTNQTSGEYDYRKFLGNYDTVSPTNVRKDEVYSRNIAIGGINVTFYYRAKTLTSQAPSTSASQSTTNSDWDICPAGYIYGNLSEESFTAIVRAPEAAPEVTYESNTQSFNYLYGNLYQFKYCYVRSDGRESSWSPVSTFLDPQQVADSLLNLTTFTNANSYNNSIQVDTILPDLSIYKSIKVAIRRSLNDSSPDDWQLAKDISLTSDLTVINSNATDSVVRLKYNGSVAAMPLDTDKATQLMSWIPKKARAQAVTARNRVVYANFTEGNEYKLSGQYSINAKPPSVRFLERSNPYNAGGSLAIYEYDGSVIAGSPVTVDVAYDFPGVSGLAVRFPATVSAGAIYALQGAVNLRVVQATGVGVENSFLLEPTPVQFNVSLEAESTSTTALITRFATELTDSLQTLLTSFRDVTFNYQALEASNVLSGGTRYLLLEPAASAATGVYSAFSFMRYIPSMTVAGSTTKPVKSFKRGTSQTFAIAYSDDYGRLTTAIEHDSFTADNTWWRDSQYSAVTASAVAGNVFSGIGTRYANMALAHDAPSWATKYHILKTNSNGITKSVYFPIAAGGLGTYPLMTDGSTNPIQGSYFFRGYLKPESTTVNASIQTPTAASLGGEELLYIPLASLQGTVFGYTDRNDAPIAYDYTDGDRLRLAFTTTNATGGTAPTVVADYFEGNVDAEIIEYLPDYNAVTIRVKDLPIEFTTTGGIFATANSAAGSDERIRGLVCEIYTPQKAKVPEFYYEIHTGAIDRSDSANSRYYHVGTEQTQTSAQAAIINLYNGDAFIKPRSYITLATSAALATATDSTVYVEDFNYFDKVPSRTWGAGRPNRAVRSTSQEEDITGFLGEVQRPTTLRYSEPFLPDQGYNGLGTINDINFKDANPALKSIQYLHTEGSRTILFHENAVGFLESDRSVITTLDGNNMTIAANTPLSDIVYYSERAGIGLNPESFAYNNNRKYFVDVDQGQVCRLSQDGITPISNGMDKYFKNIFRDMITSPDDSQAFGAYDKRTDEYTLAIKYNEEISKQNYTASGVTVRAGGTNVTLNIADTSIYSVYEGQLIRFFFPEYEISGSFYSSFDQYLEISDLTATTIELAVPAVILGIVDPRQLMLDVIGASTLITAFAILPKAETITYSERLKAWTSFHSFNPENMCSAGLDFASFREGSLYLHTDYDNPMSYYGTDYNALIDVVDNTNPDQIKIWKTTALKAVTEDAEIVETDFLVPIASGVTDSRGKLSTCTTPVYKEGQLYFDFMRTGTGLTYSGYVEGDKVRGYWTKVRYQIDAGVTKIYKVISATFDSLKSNYTR